MSEQHPDIVDNKRGFQLLYLVMRAHAVSLAVFIRHGFGSEALGFPGLHCFLLLWATTALSGDYGMAYYWGAWMVGLVFQRATTITRWFKGVREHSMYDGHPFLAAQFTHNANLAYGLVEPLFCLITGVCLGMIADMYDIEWLYSIGVWIGLGSISLSFCHWVQVAIQRRRLAAMHDMRLENETTAQMYRERYGEGR